MTHYTRVSTTILRSFSRSPLSEKTARTDLAQGRGVSGTIDIYLIVNKVFSPLTTLEFRQQFYVDFSRSPLSEKTREQTPHKATGCLAPLIFILLSIKKFRDSLHSGFDNNFTLIFPLAAERKTARTDPAQGRGVSGTVDIYLIVNKEVS